MNKFFNTVALSLLGLGNIFSQIGGPTGTGQWSNPIQFPLVPVSAANLPNGKILVWSAEHTHAFNLPGGEHTETAMYDPITNQITQTTAGHAHHNMFCPGINNLGDGKLMVTGGISTNSTSIYDPNTNSWSPGANMNLGRGYQGAVTLSSGAPFTIGGSWSGGPAGKLAEVYTPSNGWSILPNISVLNTVMDGATDPQGQYRNDNHAWMFVAPNGNIFHAGPSKNMHWMSLNNGGTYSLAKPRADDDFAIEGICVMYEKGKLLKVGGSNSYSSKTAATNKSYTIDINNASDVVVTDIPDIKRPRIFHNSVILPNGEVFVVGGMSHAKPFSDSASVLIPEIWNPSNNTWRDVKAMTIPRNYHSVAILQPDGTVLVGGGGLCNDCNTNHADAEIFSPSYLFNTNNTLATRPVISSAPSSASNNTTIQVNTNTSVSYFSLIRLSSVTHSTNNEQRYRRVPFSLISTNTYRLTIENANILVPGYYMLFAINSNGTPSLAKTIKIGTTSNICTIKPEYTIDGITSSGQVALGVASGKSMTLSVLPKNTPFTIKKPDGTVTNNNLNLGILNTTHSGKYTLAFAGCTTSLDLKVTDCNPTSILPEHNVDDVWHTDQPNQSIIINSGKALALSAMPNEIEVAKITLPDGREVTDNYGINPILPQNSGIYKMTSILGCETTLNVNVPCNITPQYNINGVWTNGTNGQVLTVQPNTTLTLSISEDQYPATIMLPNGTIMPDGYTINSVGPADLGTYTFFTNEGCFTSLTLQLGNCPASRIIPEYFLDNNWVAGSQNQELSVLAGKSLTLSMLPNIAAPLTIIKPNGSISGDHLFFPSLSSQDNGVYTLIADGCTTSIKLNVNTCNYTLLPEYNIYNNWFTATSGQNLTVPEGQPLTLSIIPNGPALSLTKPDGSLAGDHYYIPSLNSGNAGLYTFTSSDGCVAKLNISVGKCPKMAITPEYFTNGTWLTANPGSAVTITSGSLFGLSMLPNGIDVSIKKPDGTIAGDNYTIPSFTSAFNGTYTITSTQGCSTQLTLTSSGARIEEKEATESTLFEAETNSILVYPNPFNDQMDITWPESNNFNKLTFTDFTGKVLFSQIIENSQKSLHLDLSTIHLAKGTYLIKLESKDQKGLSKVLIKE